MTSPDARAELTARQAEFVAALVAGGAPPDGVDAHRLEVAARALLRKRTGEVAKRWPALLDTTAAREQFAVWARTRPRNGSFVDGWDFAEHLERTGELGTPAVDELRAVRAAWTRRPDGTVERRARSRRMWAFPRAGRRRAG